MKMRINFIGNFQSGYVGEIGDAVHLCRELEELGHTVNRIPQDEWREYVLEGYPEDKYRGVPKDLRADINIICKWHHFYDGRFIESLRAESEAPVFYWVWDYMDDQGFPDFHVRAVESCDLYLGNDVRNSKYRAFSRNNLYYFPFDVSDGQIKPQVSKKYSDVTFFGSWIGQGHRQEWLREINKKIPINVFSWNYQEWPEEFSAHPAIYGNDFAEAVAGSKIILGFNVEPNCWGYWSNRVGKVLTLGGFLLYEYAPGMELFLRDGVEYFSSPQEAVEKIDHFLIADEERERVANIGYLIGQERFTSKARVQDLEILMERFLKKGDAEWKI